MTPPKTEGDSTMFKRVDHVEIVPGNAEKTINFYVNVPGFKTRVVRK